MSLSGRSLVQRAGRGGNLALLGVLLGATLSSILVLAADPVPGASSPASSKKKGPCRALREAAIDACSAAHFEKGKHKERRGLFKDCVKPLTEGKAVEGVTIDPALVTACQGARGGAK
jgi:hypothetical protein